LLLAEAANAQEIRPEIISGPNTTTSFDDKTGEILVAGRSSVVFGQALLTADEFRYNQAKGVVIGRGHVEFTQGQRRVLAEVLTYHVAEGLVRRGEKSVSAISRSMPRVKAPPAPKPRSR